MCLYAYTHTHAHTRPEFLSRILMITCFYICWEEDSEQVFHTGRQISVWAPESPIQTESSLTLSNPN